LPVLPELLQAFEAQWQHDGLVMDNWFRLQACRTQGDTLAQVRALMSHPAFSLQNPNRVRALVGTFCAANPSRFHAADGSGYRLLMEVLLALNTMNPQVAARLIVPLIQFKRLDEGRKTLIRAELRQLAALPDLARDLYEKVSRALEQ
jgi:aminopeptidase N